jgi:hypothetical protein
MKKRRVLYVLLAIFFVSCGSPSEFKPNPTVNTQLDPPQINQVPIATAQNITLNKNTTKTIILSGIDPNGDVLTYTIIKPPINGRFENKIYTPNQNYHGSDSFSFTANDGFLTSEPVIVSIIIKTTTCKPLHKTGQTITYHNNDDGDLQEGATISYSRDDINQIVTDNVTGLMWQDNETVQKPWVTQANYDAKNYMDTSGDTATTYCENLVLGRYADWRLPTVDELHYITDKGRMRPAIDSTFQNIINNNRYTYWSSATFANSNRAWYVNFYLGNSTNSYKSFTFNVRCVRFGQ